MVDYSINSRLNNGSNGDNILTNCITIKSNLHKFTSILFVLALIFGVCGMSFGMEKNNDDKDNNQKSYVVISEILNYGDKDFIKDKEINVINESLDDQNAIRWDDYYDVLDIESSSDKTEIVYKGFKDPIVLSPISGLINIDDEYIFGNGFKGKASYAFVSGENTKKLSDFIKYLSDNKCTVTEKVNGDSIDNNVYIFALIIKKKQKSNTKEDRILIYCSNGNTTKVHGMDFGLFQGSSATTIEILNSGNNIENMGNMFHQCNQLVNLNLEKLITTNVTNMSYMFYYCSKLTSLNLSKFNTEKVTDMKGMFKKCSSLPSLNLSNWNNSNVTDMSCMFYNCSSLKDLNLSNFNTNAVTSMREMFSLCSSLKTLNLSNFNTTNVKDMSYMFYNCSSLENLQLFDFDVRENINMCNAFLGCFKGCFKDGTGTLYCNAKVIKGIIEYNVHIGLEVLCVVKEANIPSESNCKCTIKNRQILTVDNVF